MVDVDSWYIALVVDDEDEDEDEEVAKRSPSSWCSRGDDDMKNDGSCGGIAKGSECLVAAIIVVLFCKGDGERGR